MRDIEFFSRNPPESLDSRVAQRKLTHKVPRRSSGVEAEREAAQPAVREAPEVLAKQMRRNSD
jgi:hypothetical protein